MNGRKQTQMGHGEQPGRLLICGINRVILNFLFPCRRFERVLCVYCVFPCEAVTPCDIWEESDQIW